MSLWGQILRRTLYFGRRSRFDRELNDEIRFHIETRADELEQAGMPRGRALEQARREFGSDTLIREDTRAVWQLVWFGDLVRDLQYAVRALLRNPAFAVTTITCLALGIGANTTIFSLSTEMLFSKPSCRSPETLFQVWIGGSSAAPQPQYRFVRDSHAFEGIAGENEETEANWLVGDTVLRLFTVRVTDNFFSVVGIPVMSGRAILPGDSNVAVITYEFWQRKLGGEADAIGRKLILDGRPYTVIGVLPGNHRTTTGFGFSPDLYLPVTSDNTDLTLYARVPQGTTRLSATARLLPVTKELDRIYAQGNQRWEDVRVFSVSGMDRLAGDEMMPITAFFAMLMVVVGLLLLIACANVASLLLARASGRARELAIRLSIGASQGRIIRQLLTESFLLGLFGTAAGLGMNLALTSFANRFQLPLPLPVQLRTRPDWRLLGYSVLVILVCTIAAGLAPAIQSARAAVGASVKQDGHQASRGHWSLRDALVVAQLAISIVLLSGGFVFMRNLLQASSISPGFDTQHTVWTSMRLVPDVYSKPEKIRTLVDSALSELRGLPGIEAASAVRRVPLNGHSTTSTRFRTDIDSAALMVTYNGNYVSPGYFKTMRIPIVRGREFVNEDRAESPRVAIVNENMAAKLFGKIDPVGHSVRFGKDAPVLIVGVAANSRYFTIGERDALAYYKPYAQWKASEVNVQFLVRASGTPEPLIPRITGILSRLDPTAALETRPMKRALAFALLPSRVGAAVLGSTGMLGLMLAAVGLYGVLAYSVNRRVREIGVRVALGATPGGILRLVLLKGVALVGTGSAIGVTMAIFAVRTLAAFLMPNVHPTNPVTFLVVSSALCFVGLLAAAAAAVRALRLDPAVALRHD